MFSIRFAHIKIQLVVIIMGNAQKVELAYVICTIMELIANPVETHIILKFFI